MKHLKQFENHNIEKHLLDRGIDVNKTHVIINDENGDVYFFLYNFSNQMIGYQKYNPKYPKKSDDPKTSKYFNYIVDESPEGGSKIAVWGLESLDIMKDKFLFITEGIFDCARVHQSGYPGIAVLCNNPSKQMLNWLYTLPQKLIVIYDNDDAGRKLIKAGDFAYSVEIGKDLNDLSENQAQEFLDKCLIKSKLI